MISCLSLESIKEVGHTHFWLVRACFSREIIFAIKGSGANSQAFNFCQLDKRILWSQNHRITKFNSLTKLTPFRYSGILNFRIRIFIAWFDFIDFTSVATVDWNWNKESHGPWQFACWRLDSNWVSKAWTWQWNSQWYMNKSIFHKSTWSHQ